MKHLKLLLATVLGLAACATPTPSAPVSLFISADPIELAAYERVVQRLAQTNPSLKVDLINLPGAPYRARLAADFAASTPPDVFFLNYQRYAPYAAKGQLEPLGPWLGRSTVFKEADFFPQALAPLRWEGALTCLPMNLSSAVIYVNRTLLAKAELAPPRDGWSWDDMTAMATKAAAVTVDGRRAHGFGGEVSLFRAAPYVWSNGGEVIGADGRLALGSPAARAALQKWVDLQVKLGVAPNAADDKAEDPLARFSAGRLAFLMDSRRIVPALRDAVNSKFDWDVVALPRHGTAQTILHSDAICMAASSKNKAGAFAVIEAVIGPEGQRQFAEIGRSVPSLRAVAESPSFLTPGAAPANSKVWLDNAARLRYAPVNAAWPELETRINVELENAFYGRKPLDDALRAIEALGP